MYVNEVKQGMNAVILYEKVWRRRVFNFEAKKQHSFMSIHDSYVNSL